MTIRKHILAAALASSMMGLAACGGGSKGSQDVGSGGNGIGATSRTFYARAIDGYLAGATVYVDQNENNRLDTFEPRALTDNDGYFSYNHLTETDYCVTGGLSEHCLRGNIDAGAEVLIRVTGGYDTVTQLPFKGVLTLRSSELGRDDMRVVTPGTSMVADASADAATQAKLQALIEAGIFDTSVDDNPMELGHTRAQMAVILSRVMGMVGEVEHGSAFEDFEHDAWYQGYIGIAQHIGEQAEEFGSATFGDVFSSQEDIGEWARRVLYATMHLGATPPESYALSGSPTLVKTFEGAAELVALNEEMLESLNGETLTVEQRQAILRLQAIVAERLMTDPYDPELADLIAWVRNQLAQGNGLGSDLSALGGENIDLSAIIDPQFDFDPASNTISASATIPAEAASTFAALVNKSFGVTRIEPDEQGAALFFVSGEAGARSGEIDLCVRYRGDDEDFDTTSSSDPNGAMLIGGRWSLLDVHTLTLSIDIAGGVRSLLLKAVNGSGLDRDYRFDFGGDDLSKWSGSAPSAFATGAVPADDAACAGALLDAFGPMT